MGPRVRRCQSGRRQQWPGARPLPPEQSTSERAHRASDTAPCERSQSFGDFMAKETLQCGRLLSSVRLVTCPPRAGAPWNRPQPLDKSEPLGVLLKTNLQVTLQKRNFVRNGQTELLACVSREAGEEPAWRVRSSELSVKRKHPRAHVSGHLPLWLFCASMDPRP